MLACDAPIPAELRGVVWQAVLEFFSAPSAAERAALHEVVTSHGAAAAARCAEALTTRLCGPAYAAGVATGAYDLCEGADASARRRRRVLLTGCFDLMHAGHYNALRQARMAFPGDEVVLVVGVHSDEAIEAAKGAPPVWTHEERMEMVLACRWTDEVVGDLPYEVSVSLLDRLNCEVAVHGDDLPRGVTGGSGLFDELIGAGRLKIVKRTEGTSTTMLIGRLLSMSKEHLQKNDAPVKLVPSLVSEAARQAPEAVPPFEMLFPTMSRMSLFYAERSHRLGDAKAVVYAPGEWDLFHPGHVRFLEQARALGDFLLVGCYSDQIIHRKKGFNYPLQTLHERALNVLACKHVDDVLLGAPWQVAQDLLTTLNVSAVVTGRTNVYHEAIPKEEDPFGLGDPFEQARASGRLRVIHSNTGMTMDVIADRILARTLRYTRRQHRKEPVDRAYHALRAFVREA